jgi:hypothetical protein
MMLPKFNNRGRTGVIKMLTDDPLRVAVRNRLPHELCETTAAMAGLQVWHLQQFFAGAYDLNDEQVLALANYLNVKVPT